MPSVRDQIRMDDAEFSALLNEVHTFSLATIGDGGRPHLTAMWFAVADGMVSFWTFTKSQKTLNMRRDPRVTCLFEAGRTYDELRGAMVEGTAHLLDDDDDALRIGALVAMRYNPALTRSEATRVAGHQAGKRTGVQIEVTNVASWDHRKLP